MVKDNCNNMINTGREDVIKYLYESYFVRLIIFANNIIDNKNEAEDLVQKLFIKLWKKEISFKSHIKIKSYLYNSVKNSCLDYLKTAKREIELSEFIVKSVDEYMIETETVAEILSSIMKLPKIRRNVLLSKMEGMTIEDICTKFDISKNTVKTHLRLAKEELKKELNNNILFLIFFTS